MAKKTGKKGRERIKQRGRDIQPACAQNWVAFLNTPLKQDLFLFGTRLSFIDHDSHYDTRKIKEAIHIRLQPNNINGDDKSKFLIGWHGCV